MAPIYDYRCCEGHLTESRQGYGVDAIPCPTCGQEAPRVPVYLQNHVGDRAGVPLDQRRYDLSLFREATEERAWEHGRAEERAQRPLPESEGPSLWKGALSRAQEVKAGKAPPPSGTA